MINDMPGNREGHLIPVDYGGHSWTFSAKIMPMIYAVQPLNYENSEDLHISASAYIHSNITTMMPINLPEDSNSFTNTFIYRHKGEDVFASHRRRNMRNTFLRERYEHYCFWKDHGYKPLLQRS